MGKRRDSDKVSQWGNQKEIPTSIWVCHTMSLIPQPSPFGGQEESKCRAVAGTGKNYSGLLHLLPGPRAGAVQTLATVFRARCVPTVCFFLTQSSFIRKLRSGKKLRVLVIRSTSNLPLILFQISWGRNSISAANFIPFSSEKFS